MAGKWVGSGVGCRAALPRHHLVRTLACSTCPAQPTLTSSPPPAFGCFPPLSHHNHMQLLDEASALHKSTEAIPRADKQILPNEF